MPLSGSFTQQHAVHHAHILSLYGPSPFSVSPLFVNQIKLHIYAFLFIPFSLQWFWVFSFYCPLWDLSSLFTRAAISAVVRVEYYTNVRFVIIYYEYFGNRLITIVRKTWVRLLKF